MLVPALMTMAITIGNSYSPEALSSPERVSRASQFLDANLACIYMSSAFQVNYRVRKTTPSSNTKPKPMASQQKVVRPIPQYNTAI